MKIEYLALIFGLLVGGVAVFIFTALFTASQKADDTAINGDKLPPIDIEEDQ